MLEKFFYLCYAGLNKKRKSKETSNVIYKAFDDIRRKIGFVK